MPLHLPLMSPCYLCEIIEGTGDSWIVIERTDLTMTMLNGRQYEVGQCMVVTLRHAPTILDLEPPEERAVMGAARRAARALVEAFDPDGVLLYQNNGAGSGQEVPHFHLHVVPRRAGSGWGLGPPHLARVERRVAAVDHAAVTEAKRQTAAVLRARLAGRSETRDPRDESAMGQDA